MESIEKTRIAKLVMAVLTLFCVTLVVWKGLVPGWKNLDSDFPNYYTASRLLLEGEPVAKFYDNDWFEEQAHQRGIDAPARFSPFPPITSVLAIPLSFFEPLVAKRIWLLFNVFLLFVLIAQLRMITNLSFGWVFFIAFWLALPLMSNFRMGQFYLVLVCGMLAAYQAAIRNRSKSAGNLLAILTIFKYVPITLLMAFGILGNKRIWIMGSITLLVLFGFQILFFGMDTWQTYVNVLLGHLSGEIPGQGRFVPAFQSIDSFAAHLFIYDAEYNPNPLADLPAMPRILKYSFLALVLLIGSLTLYSSKGRNKRTYRDITLIVVSLGTLLVLPATATYHFLLLFFPVTLFLRVGKDHLRLGDVLVLFALLFVSANTSSFTVDWQTGSDVIDLILSYPRLWGLCGLYLFTNWWLGIAVRKRRVENLIYG
ncbi:DUF2029 domain-containing protein [bacterium SCSIO 12741]|nr:DUF2029 domain-containing protein [bacterium SCSIO 12741]